MEGASSLPGSTLPLQLDSLRLDQRNEVGAILHPGHFDGWDHQALPVLVEAGPLSSTFSMSSKHFPHTCTVFPVGKIVTGPMLMPGCCRSDRQMRQWSNATSAFSRGCVFIVSSVVVGTVVEAGTATLPST
jgi:hypothetical protein